MKQLYAIEEQENAKISQLLSSLGKQEKEIAECQRNIMNIKQHATNLQVYLSMKKIEEEVYIHNQLLQSFEGSKNFQQLSLSYKINPSIQNIMSDIISFGEVRIEAKPCNIVLIKKTTKQAQMMVPTVQSRSIKNIQLTLQSTINTQGDAINGCCMLSDGRMAFTHYWECKVLVYNTKGIKDFEVKMPGYAFDIAYISKNNTLAVSSGASAKKRITIIDLEKKNIKKTISLKSNCYGIAFTENRLIFSGNDKGILMVNLYDGSISTIVQDFMSPDCYTAIFRDNIYHTNPNENTVTCYNLQGYKQWTFHNERVLKNPCCIDVDSEGNVYVLGDYHKNVVVISPDGQRHREVLTSRDCPFYPQSLHYNGPMNKLLVANYYKTVQVFDVI